MPKTFRRADPAIPGWSGRAAYAKLRVAMTTAELRKTRLSDEVLVDWRREQLVRAGYDTPSALILAKRSHVDLHGAIELLEHGCPPRIALEILL